MPDLIWILVHAKKAGGLHSNHLCRMEQKSCKPLSKDSEDIESTAEDNALTMDSIPMVRFLVMLLPDNTEKYFTIECMVLGREFIVVCKLF